MEVTPSLERPPGSQVIHSEILTEGLLCAVLFRWDQALTPEGGSHPRLCCNRLLLHPFPCVRARTLSPVYHLLLHLAQSCYLIPGLAIAYTLAKKKNLIFTPSLEGQR